MCNWKYTRWAFAFFACFMCGMALGFFFGYRKESKTVINNHVIDSLQVKNDTLNNTIYKSTERIKELQAIYEQNIKMLDTLPPNKQCSIFAGFVSKDSL